MFLEDTSSKGKNNLNVCAVALCVSFSRALSNKDHVYLRGWELGWKTDKCGAYQWPFKCDKDTETEGKKLEFVC